MVYYGGMDRALGILGIVILSVYISFFFGLSGIIIKKALCSPVWAYTVIPAVWVFKDLILENLFGGFPWEFAGYSQSANTIFIQISEIGGVHLITFLVILINVSFFLFIKKRKSVHIFVLLFTFLAVYISGFFLLRADMKREERITKNMAGIIQPNTGQNFGSEKVWKRVSLDEMFDESITLKEKGAEFVIWPEYSIGIAPLQNRFFFEKLSTFSAVHLPVIAGFTDYQSSEEMYNSVMLFKKNGFDKYDKVRLVPFGEYIPFRKLFFFVNKITDEVSDFTPGKEIRNLRLMGKKISTPVCYEIIYPGLVRRFIHSGGEVIVLVSNDSWYGTSSAPYQLLSMSVFRAVENRRYLLRSTSNGISSVIDPRGRIIRMIPLNQQESFVSGFRFRNRKTVYTRAGFIFPYFCAVMVLFFIIIKENKGIRTLIKKRSRV